MRHRPLGRASFACVLSALMGLALAPAASARFGDTALRKGSHGHDVKVLQSWLTHLGYRTSVDGAFGRGTWRSVRRFEHHERIRVDGVVGISEEALLRKRMQALASNPTDPPSLAPGEKARLSTDGRTADAPADAPVEVQEVIAAANEITDTPYRYGGGHGRGFNDSAFDCSGAVSHALHGAGLVTTPARLHRFRELGIARPRALDHRLRELGPRLPGGGGPALRHLRQRRERPALAAAAPLEPRLRGPAPRRLLA